MAEAMPSAEEAHVAPAEEDYPTDDAAPAIFSQRPAAPRRSRNRLIFAILAGLAVILVLVGVVTWHYIGHRSTSLKTPGTVAGLSLDDSGDAQQTAEYLRTAVAAKINLDDSIGAVYRDPANSDRDVLFFGGTGLIINPAKDLDQAFSLLNDSSGVVTGLRDVPAGDLGGVMRCGTSTGDGGPMVVCGWADRGSLAIALFPGRSVDEAAQLLRTMRAGVEHN